MRRGILLSSPPGRGELRLIPLLNQEGVGGGLLSHCEPFALLPPWFQDTDCSVSPPAREASFARFPSWFRRGLGGGPLVQEGVGDGPLSHCEPFALLPPWFRTWTAR